MTKQGLPLNFRELFGTSNKKKTRSKPSRNNRPEEPAAIATSLSSSLSVHSSVSATLSSSSPRPQQQQQQQNVCRSVTTEKETRLWTEAIALIDERMSSTPSRKTKTVPNKPPVVTRSLFRTTPRWGKRPQTQDIPKDKYFVRADSEEMKSSTTWNRRQDKIKERRSRDESDDDSSTCSDDASMDSQESVELTFRSLMCDFKQCLKFESENDSDDENVTNRKQVVKKNKNRNFLDDILDRWCN